MSSSAVLLLLAGLVLVVVGIGLWSVPGGIVAAGAALCLMAYAWAAGDTEE